MIEMQVNAETFSGEVTSPRIGSFDLFDGPVKVDRRNDVQRLAFVACCRGLGVFFRSWSRGSWCSFESEATFALLLPGFKGKQWSALVIDGECRFTVSEARAADLGWI